MRDMRARANRWESRSEHQLVFNIGGNNYRIVIWINYPYCIVHVRFIGSHRIYDAIDVQTNLGKSHGHCTDQDQTGPSTRIERNWGPHGGEAQHAGRRSS
ncbi:MAG: type II toxin-antitoxin system HigB family toxin [Rhodobacteraceae bacterium]|nr:type II toxin-antitoxin system HigB family toxin [Paracoccaceae bacterium]